MASALGKAFDVLRVLRRTSGPLTLTAIAEAVGIAPSTAHSVLTELASHGAVVQNGEKRYRTGPAIYYWGASYARNTPIFRSTWSELVDVCNELGVVGAVAVPWEDHHLILQSHHGGRSELGVAFGGRVPLDGGSWGKVYYAWSGVPLPKRVTHFTDASITDRVAYEREIEATRERGYATDMEEFAAGVMGVAAAVTGEQGYEGLASILAPASMNEALPIDELGRRLAAIAARASFSLGDTSRMRMVGAE